eukprot:238442_1
MAARSATCALYDSKKAEFRGGEVEYWAAAMARESNLSPPPIHLDSHRLLRVEREAMAEEAGTERLAAWRPIRAAPRLAEAILPTMVYFGSFG